MTYQSLQKYLINWTRKLKSKEVIKNIKIIPLLFLVLFSACTYLENAKNKLETPSNALSLGKTFAYTIKEEGCSGNCAQVNISYPTLEQHPKINEFIDRTVKNELLNLIRNKKNGTSIRKLLI